MVTIEIKTARQNKCNINLPYKNYSNIRECNNNIIHHGIHLRNVSYGLSIPNIDGSPPNIFLQNIHDRMKRYYEK